MLRPELQLELTATRDAMAGLRAIIMKARLAAPAAGRAGDTPAARLKAFRLSKGLSQRALAARLGVSRSFVGDIEAGRTQPSREFARKMIGCLGVSADWLLFGGAQ